MWQFAGVNMLSKARTLGQGEGPPHCGWRKFDDGRSLPPGRGENEVGSVGHRLSQLLGSEVLGINALFLEQSHHRRLNRLADQCIHPSAADRDGLMSCKSALKETLNGRRTANVPGADWARQAMAA